MRYFFTFILLVTIATACKQRIISGPELEKKLIKTMQDYLDETGKQTKERNYISANSM
jgi:hypothetical protein